MLYLARPGDYEKYDIVIAWLAPISLHKEWCKQKNISNRERERERYFERGFKRESVIDFYVF